MVKIITDHIIDKNLEKAINKAVETIGNVYEVRVLKNRVLFLSYGGVKVERLCKVGDGIVYSLGEPTVFEIQTEKLLENLSE